MDFRVPLDWYGDALRALPLDPGGRDVLWVCSDDSQLALSRQVRACVRSCMRYVRGHAAGHKRLLRARGWGLGVVVALRRAIPWGC